MLNKLFAFCLITVTAFISSCGGGGGGGGNSAPTPTPTPKATVLTGVVASGAPLAGYTVTVLSASKMASGGGAGYSTTTDANGNYTISIPSDIPDGAPPYEITASRDTGANSTYPRLFSIALSGGVANINPLTDLLVSQLSPPNSSTNYQALASATPAQLETARQAVITYLLTRPERDAQSLLSPVDASKLGDFITSPMQPISTDPYDMVLEQLQQTLVTGENIFAIEVDMLERNLPPLDITNLSGGIYCDAAQCGQAASAICGSPGCTNPAPPYIPKYPVIRRLAQQIKLAQQVNIYGVIMLDCGSSITSDVPLSAGVNTFAMDGTVLRINNSYANKSAISLLGANIKYFIDKSTTGGANYIYNATIISGSLQLSINFNESSVQDASFTSGTSAAVTCHP